MKPPLVYAGLLDYVFKFGFDRIGVRTQLPDFLRALKRLRMIEFRDN